MNTGPGEGLEEPDPGAGREFPTQEGPGPGSESVRASPAPAAFPPQGHEQPPKNTRKKGENPPKKRSFKYEEDFRCSGRVLLSLLGASRVEVCRVSLLFGPSLTAPHGLQPKEPERKRGFLPSLSPPKNIKSNKFTKIENNYSNRQEGGGGREVPGLYLAEQCNIRGWFRASSSRCSSRRSTSTSRMQPMKPVLKALGSLWGTLGLSSPPGNGTGSGQGRAQGTGDSQTGDSTVTHSHKVTQPHTATTGVCSSLGG